MLVANLLARGMLVGLVAALLSFAFLKVAGEPALDRAIAFGTQMDDARAKAKREEAVAKGLPAPVEEMEPELVSRNVQSGVGLLVGVTVYSVAFGGLFALVYALAFGRMGAFGARSTSALIALSGFVAVYLVPSLKYPANPPSIGEAETIALRTQLYFSLIAFSLAAMVAAWVLRKRLLSRFGAWDAAAMAAGAYLVAMAVAFLALPGVNETPEGFPAETLWRFRMASLGGQAIMWATIGLVFGALTERAQSAAAVRLRAA
jgi:predicted cobalt transporter CbtA